MKKRYIVLILIVLLINQSVSFVRNMVLGFTPFLIGTFLFGLLCDAGLIYYIVRLKEKEKIKKELEEVRYQAEREKLYYQELENQRAEMAKLRHDNNNLITSALGLVHMGRKEDAIKLLHEWNERLSASEGENKNVLSDH